MATKDEKDVFDRPWLILCEGDSDKYFFHKLIEQHEAELSGKFSVRFAGQEYDSGGRSKFGGWLKGRYTLNSSFQDNVKAVLIVSDNDNNPIESFEEIRTTLRSAEFPVPDVEQTVVVEEGYPAVVVLMIPIGQCGNLETLCLEAAYHQEPGLDGRLNAFTDGMPAAGWDVGKRSKARMQARTAVMCVTAPAASLAAHWRWHSDCNVCLDDPCFSEIAEFLLGFEEMMAAAGMVP